MQLGSVVISSIAAACLLFYLLTDTLKEEVENNLDSSSSFPSFASLSSSTRRSCSNSTYFDSIVKRDSTWCPKEVWLVLMYLVDPDPRKLFINIGLNKGYALLQLYEAWAPPVFNITPTNWNNSLIYDRENKTKMTLCGQSPDLLSDLLSEFRLNYPAAAKSITSLFSQEGKKSMDRFWAKDLGSWWSKGDAPYKKWFPPTKKKKGTKKGITNRSLLQGESEVEVVKAANEKLQEGTTNRLLLSEGGEVAEVGKDANDGNEQLILPRGIGVEPVPLTIPIVKGALTTLKLDPYIQVVEGGGSDKPGVMYGHNKHCALPGMEICVLKPTQDENYSMPIRIYTLEEIMYEYVDKKYDPLDADSAVIDILIVDTEGNDFYVLLGGVSLFGHQKIRFLMFEYHALSRWQEWNLATVVNLLDGYGYECYYAGFLRVWRLNHCIDALYEKQGWSNVVCVLRSDIWFQVFEELEACRLNPALCR